MTLVTPVTLAVIILAVVAKHGTGVFKKQGVAWAITGVMIVAAICIGYAKSPAAGTPEAPNTPGSASSFVRDDANALSARTIRELDSRNDRLWDRHNVTVAVVTCNNQRDLGDYAYRQAESMGLGGYDMVVALDIRGDNYWLLLGADVDRDFPYDPSDYAYEYMEGWFVRGNYDDAVLSLTEALEAWYGSCYG